jgi:hypothetical protein
VHVAWSENHPFAVAELVETEQGMKANSPEVAVVGGSFLVAVHRTLGTVQVQNNPPVVSAGHSTFHLWTDGLNGDYQVAQMTIYLRALLLQMTNPNQ